MNSSRNFSKAWTCWNPWLQKCLNGKKTSDDLIVPVIGNTPYTRNQISLSRWRMLCYKIRQVTFLPTKMFSSSNASFKQINRLLWLGPQIICPGYSNSSTFSNSYWTLTNAGIIFPAKIWKAILAKIFSDSDSRINSIAIVSEYHAKNRKERQLRGFDCRPIFSLLTKAYKQHAITEWLKSWVNLSQPFTKAFDQYC